MLEENSNAKRLLSLTERDVFYFFGTAIGAEGDAYQRSGRVLAAKLEHGAKTLSGEVQGSVIRPYEVVIRLASEGLKSTCSCSMRALCKHSAALLFDLVRGGRVNRIAVKKALSAQEDLKGLYYLLELATSPDRLLFTAIHAFKLQSGEWGTFQKADLNRITLQSASYITEEDCAIARSFLSATKNAAWIYRNTFPEIEKISKALLQRAVETGRCYWKELGSKALSWGSDQHGELLWETQTDGRQQLRLSAENGKPMIFFAAGATWYFDAKEQVLGQLKLAADPQSIKKVLSLGALHTDEALSLCKTLAGNGAAIPSPRKEISTKTIKLKPSANLTLLFDEQSEAGVSISASKSGKALLRFDYGAQRFKGNETEIRAVENGNIVIYQRDTTFETASRKQLKQAGMEALEVMKEGALENSGEAFIFKNGSELEWLKFSVGTVPKLEKSGWNVNYHKSFNLKLVKPAEQWSLNTSEGSDFWLAFDLGVEVEGQRVQLLPIIRAALKTIPNENLSSGLEKLNYDGMFFAPLGDGRHVALPFDRVKLIVETFTFLFNRRSQSSDANTNISLPQLMNITGQLESFTGANTGVALSERFSELIKKVKHFQGIRNVAPPADFAAALRPYQLEGLCWLNFLREFQLGGILADDMGLGKTVQTLAHISLEKSEGRLNKPFLVVCPTSVLPNWQNEISKFAPGLKATALWGTERSKEFQHIFDSDLVVTTYPLLNRDADILLAQEWKAVILDEAQMIKNPTTQVAKAAGRLNCDYRICLTGTPVENHLGELWSQFNFLMPGFLLDQQNFSKLFRVPIEKQNDKDAQKILTDQVRPFLLRRTKELVAKELPEKSIIIKRIKLEGSQRDLYETVRLAMFEKINEAVDAKGIERSRIVILDALLKLRQVCCDPRLLSLQLTPRERDIKGSAPSAKLELLVNMLEELSAEGKRVLLFSQFTSMLDLIIPELRKRKIDFVEIRGNTKDRNTPVKLFQEGATTLFLLSLKSGGFGLNLTAADTVIHYDPWWNPAVENQATDRAHRIGQSKSVFVFKLIAAGTIEERMLELQERKQVIAEAVFDEEKSLPFELSADDLATLFKPLDGAKNK